MSNEVFGIAKRRVMGSATIKAVLMMMADNASDDGTGVWVSKANIARDLELSKRAVQLSIGSLVAMGILSQTGRKPCLRGFTFEYCINLKALLERPSTRESHPPLTSELDSQVHTIHPSGRTAFTPTSESHSSKPPFEPSLEPHNNTCEADQSKTGNILPAPDRQFDRFWAVFPKKVGKPAAEKAWAKAVKRADPETIIQRATAYARTDSVTRGFAKHPQGWLNDDRWNDHDLVGEDIDPARARLQEITRQARAAESRPN